MKKRPRLTPHHRKERLDFAIRYQYWTLEDWKKVVWSDETRINHLGSDGRKRVWEKAGEGLSGRVVEGTLEFQGDLGLYIVGGDWRYLQDWWEDGWEPLYQDSGG